MWGAYSFKHVLYVCCDGAACEGAVKNRECEGVCEVVLSDGAACEGAINVNSEM